MRKAKFLLACTFSLAILIFCLFLSTKHILDFTSFLTGALIGVIVIPVSVNLVLPLWIRIFTKFFKC